MRSIKGVAISFAGTTHNETYWSESKQKWKRILNIWRGGGGRISFETDAVDDGNRRCRPRGCGCGDGNSSRRRGKTERRETRESTQNEETESPHSSSNPSDRRFAGTVGMHALVFIRRRLLQKVQPALLFLNQRAKYLGLCSWHRPERELYLKDARRKVLDGFDQDKD